MRMLFACASLALAFVAPPAFAEELPTPGAENPGFVYPPDPEYTYATKRLDRGELDGLFAHPEGVLVLDVRRPDEVTLVGGFPVYLSVQVADLEQSLTWLPRDRRIIVVSNRAHRAGAAGDLLARHGFDVAGAIGVRDYEEQGGTVTHVAAQTE